MRIALAGNPNSGKTTLFNALTGSHQFVGNWPGVTVEKKEGEYRKDDTVKITDLPGIYSLSPYTLEEVVSRKYLLNEHPDVIINIIDGVNLERNLYLTTQLLDLDIPVVVAVNRMDVVRAKGDVIDRKGLSKALKTPVVEISALKKENLDELMATAVGAGKKDLSEHISYDPQVENAAEDISEIAFSGVNAASKRFYALKLIEGDDKLDLSLTDDQEERIADRIRKIEDFYDDDGEGVMTEARYEAIASIVEGNYKQASRGQTTSDKIDAIVTNRILALPIFIALMTGVYYISAVLVGGPITDWVNDVLLGKYAADAISHVLIALNTAEWLHSLVIDGIVAGVSAVLGFLPLIATLYFFLAVMEDVGYMSRIAFILDRIFRKFGLSGKSFIPILIGTGCSVPGIMATRTIENDNDRRMTIVVASFMPCGAKTDLIALFVASFGFWYFLPIAYFSGIAAVIVSGLILKKTSIFQGDPAPFVMELPEYHMPSAENVLKSVWERCKAFIKKAGTVILVASVAIWFLQNISVQGEFVEFAESTDSILSALGKVIAPIFTPLGFGNWQATVASVTGLVAKEAVVSTYGIIGGIADGNEAGLNMLITSQFTFLAALSFMLFNQLNVPCFAAIGAIREEMKSKFWTVFALVYQTVFAYGVALVVYQIGRVIAGGPFTVWTGVAIAVMIAALWGIVRKPSQRSFGLRESEQLS
ncbi:MAG: ferrous iron transport protein B [Peptoniphilus sp.]|nr:ferrous iron transport protein B [Peptoniphilus sp.]MDD7363652.1 ferrous iron transport protein B [Bacillota bacterium]MDY6044702.1 ferrous iron transport protein B [Peptoniphilus sp.]